MARIAPCASKRVARSRGLPPACRWTCGPKYAGKQSMCTCRQRAKSRRIESLTGHSAGRGSQARWGGGALLVAVSAGLTGKPNAGLDLIVRLFEFFKRDAQVSFSQWRRRLHETVFRQIRIHENDQEAFCLLFVFDADYRKLIVWHRLVPLRRQLGRLAWTPTRTVPASWSARF
jgi:hypothetical protein